MTDRLTHLNAEIAKLTAALATMRNPAGAGANLIRGRLTVMIAEREREVSMH